MNLPKPASCPTVEALTQPQKVFADGLYGQWFSLLMVGVVRGVGVCGVVFEQIPQPRPAVRRLKSRWKLTHRG